MNRKLLSVFFLVLMAVTAEAEVTYQNLKEFFSATYDRNFDGFATV
jgi:hypothetical protein